MLREQLHQDMIAAGMDDIPIVFISAVTGKGLDTLKDILWEELNSESNKLQTITSEDTLVHRDKDMSRFAEEMAEEGEDDEIEYVDIEDVEDDDDWDEDDDVV